MKLEPGHYSWFTSKCSAHFRLTILIDCTVVKNVSSYFHSPVDPFCIICVKSKKLIHLYEVFRKYRGSKIAQNCRILCGTACCHDKSWLNLTTFKNSRELYSQIFSRAFFKVVKIWHTGIPGPWTQELGVGLWTLDSGRWTLNIRACLRFYL